MKLRPLTAALALTVTLTAATPALADTARPGTTAPASDCALPGKTGWTDEGHNTDYTQFQQPLGTKHVLMLFVDFPDAPASGSLDDYYRELAPAQDWMKQDSYGRLHLEIDPLKRWITMPQTSASYGFQRGITFDQQELYVKQAVQAAAPYTDFSKYDMLYIVPTRSASAIAFSPTYLYDPTTAGITVNGTRIKWAITFGQDMYHWGYKVADHETSHTFGLPDLYAFTGTDVHPYVGGWDLMGNIAGPAPQHTGWERWKFGWIDDAQVACLPATGSRTVRLKAVERPGGTKIAVIRTGGSTAYVAESRRAMAGDANSCSTGVLIYKVDTSITTGDGPIQVVTNPNAGAPTGNCTTLDMQTWQPGQWFQDDTARIRIYVNASDASSDTLWTYKW
ncbi:M6 family metalloprotease domain-containing protein [Kitasatospora acidiphila]|uniref:M6 family metalloprotease domain-containing protein n=1 Tax=Kitasatospora acidiphila TaxID=2567942 RepID=A0A540VXP4_9ACTN|nr:M6 family metalloprotease domain-containing protein [Kitasatospora acidiphila]TQF01529.1 M6 family metalloprotease domain-containing protein [Kitasatospora acidiphila]